jgi:diguanylate cyclase (GGDEF)-like protein
VAGGNVLMKNIFKSKIHLLVYTLLLVLIVAILIYVSFIDKTKETRQLQSAYNITEWEDYSSIESMSQTIVSGTITVDDSVGNILSFYSVHQSIYLYIDDELIYQYPIENNNPFSNSPGYNWNFVELPNRVNNVKIVIKSPYKQYLSEIPTFNIGNVVSLVSNIIEDNLVSFLMCIAMLVGGIVLIIYHFIISHSMNTNGKLLKLGFFSIILAIWSINECNITVLFLRNNIVTSYVAFLSLMMLPFPFAKFVQTFYEDDSKIWDIFYAADVIQIALSLLLCLIGFYDLRQTLWLTHMLLVFVIITILYKSFSLMQDIAMSKNVKIHLFCIIICLFTLVMDLIGFYLGLHDNNRFGRMGFFLYILILGISSMRESVSLMKRGQEADTYQKLAYTDQMTGLNNRTCFNKDFEIASSNPEDVAVIDFDLNNLKRTNDTFGHSVGDKYIKTCASIIQEIFDGIGKCYRVGGDEFVAIIEKASTIDMTHYLAMLESSVDSANKGYTKMKMQIAYGYTVYNANIDKNLEDTYNRADKIMYQDKENKKTIRRN